MRADSCGTLTEQARHRCGWKRPATRPPLPACKDCAFVDVRWEDRYPKDKATWRCGKHDFATAPGCWCNDFLRGAPGAQRATDRP